MTTVDFLRKVRALIERPENWTMRVPARDKYGLRTSAADPDAVSFCLAGACWRLRDETTDPCYIKALNLLNAQAKPHDNFAVFNDSSTHEEVLALLDRAIKEAMESSECQG